MSYTLNKTLSVEAFIAQYANDPRYSVYPLAITETNGIEYLSVLFKDIKQQEEQSNTLFISYSTRIDIS